MSVRVPQEGITVPIYDEVTATLNRIAAEQEAARVTPDSDRHLRHVIVRCQQAGVFAGLLHWRSGTEVTLLDARRIWYWSGAATLSELALRGTRDPDGCTFPPAVPEITLLGVCEIIPTTPAAQISLAAVPDWTAWTADELAKAVAQGTPQTPPTIDPHDGAGTAPGRGPSRTGAVGHDPVDSDFPGDGGGVASGVGGEDGDGVGEGYPTGEGSVTANGSGQPA